MTWTVDYGARARRQLRSLDRQVADRIMDFMDERVATRDNPREIGKALHGRWSGHWGYRVGGYRVICEVQDSALVVMVIEVGGRGGVYR